MPSNASFAEKLVAWQRRHGRKDLPWQGTRDPYRIWLSEVMLQQTQVAAVIPYYERFLARYPDIQALARASEEEVLSLWSGLGYYARGRNLHSAARKIVADYSGKFPAALEEIAQLPGIGRSTAAAIAAFAFGRRAAILDGNVKRVLARRFGIEGFSGERAVETRLWKLAESLVPRKNVGAYTQGLMDLGATVCTKRQPRCVECPVRRSCIARRQGRTHELPAPRPKKEIPLKQATWIVLLKSGEVLLERRPSSGLWGGLWTFPETDQKDLVAYCRRTLGYAIGATRNLEPLEHGFTHFRLRVQPVVCEVGKPGLRAEAPGRLWLDLAAARTAAIPAPVRALLARLSAGN
jgi:A/G-specific adenine glycosylase